MGVAAFAPLQDKATDGGRAVLEKRITFTRNRGAAPLITLILNFDAERAARRKGVSPDQLIIQAINAKTKSGKKATGAIWNKPGT